MNLKEWIKEVAEDIGIVIVIIIALAIIGLIVIYSLFGGNGKPFGG